MVYHIKRNHYGVDMERGKGKQPNPAMNLGLVFLSRLLAPEVFKDSSSLQKWEWRGGCLKDHSQSHQHPGTGLPEPFPPPC